MSIHEPVTEMPEDYSVWDALCPAVEACNARYGRERIYLFGEGEKAVFYANRKLHFREREYPLVSSNIGYVYAQATGNRSSNVDAADIVERVLEMYIDPD